MLVYLGVAVPAGERPRVFSCRQLLDERLGVFTLGQTGAPSFYRSDVFIATVRTHAQWTL